MWSTFLFLIIILLTSSCSQEEENGGAQEDFTDEDNSPGTVLLFFTVTDIEKLPHAAPSTTGLPNNTVITVLPNNTIRSAISTDGYHFTIHPEHWITHEDMMDPAVWLGDDSLWMLTSSTVNGRLRFTFARPCPNFIHDSFTVLESFSTPQEGEDGRIVSVSGGIPDIISVPGGYRLFYAGEGGIQSMFSSDGRNYTKEEGLRLALTDDMPVSVIADPAVARRADGSYVMYFKAIPTIFGTSSSPYDHNMYRATSKDSITFVAEDMEKPLLEHVSIPGIYTDALDRVWVYYLNFAAGWPEEFETVWATYEEKDYTLREPQEVTFTPALLESEFINDPDPLLLPEDFDFSKCTRE